ncbi:MAG: efflux transporter outer membrane subunit [Vampirovibrionales bacterium]|nr:efflux transporter outer membrane subunit [Vampirovibrionales bacterium]
MIVTRVMALMMSVIWLLAATAGAQVSASAVSAQEAWQQLPSQPPVVSTAPRFEAQYPTSFWWEGFGDPQLNGLVEAALNHSPSLASVEERIKEAEGQKLIASSRLKPQAQVGASYAWQYYSKSQFPFPLEERIFQLFSTPLQASYELDWLGQARNQRSIAIKGVDQARFQYQSARIALASAVVTRYVQWAALESLMDVHTQWVQGLEQLKAHAQALLDAGQEPVMTLRDAEAALAQGNAQLASDNALRVEVKNQLAVLVGQTPAQFSAVPLAKPVLAALTVWESLPAGLPATLLDHRPDIQIAESMLEAADIQIKVAKKNFLPRITITGQTGFTSLYAHRWLTLDALSSAITPAITAPLLTGGANKGRLKIAKSQRQQALNHYLDAVNTACGEVETALARVQAANQTLAEQTQRKNATFDKVSRIKLRYDLGLDSQPTYWIASLESVPAESDAIVQRAQLALETVRLLSALGGGFKPPGNP